jgi:hypothetical protein
MFQFPNGLGYFAIQFGLLDVNSMGLGIVFLTQNDIELKCRTIGFSTNYYVTSVVWLFLQSMLVLLLILL